jgi:N-carbamoylputrescine amidase
MRIAMIAEVFYDDSDGRRLDALLSDIRADLAVLPELPFLPWRPAGEIPVEGDAEPPGGPSQRRLADAARRHRTALLGGAIVRDEVSGARHNTAMLVDAEGVLRATYRKLHLPSEPGFWEDRHYQPGEDPPRPVEGFELPLGVQLCSDVNRPAGSHILAAMGAEVLLCPRATEAATFDRWRLMLRANAMAGACWVISVTRPRPEFGVPLGGPSVAIGPDGDVIEETLDTVAIVEVDHARVAGARGRYPGYLAVRPEVYARGWAQARASEKV